MKNRNEHTFLIIKMLQPRIATIGELNGDAISTHTQAYVNHLEIFFLVILKQYLIK